MKVLDLFSGIGGLSLGLERAGMETVAFCEMNAYARAVLRKHWPKIPIYRDVRKLTGECLKFTVDVICGGFPCQDVSVAKQNREALSGKRSGLWFEFKRIIEEAKPKYVVIENVSNLRSQGLARVIKDLWEIGYVGEWHVIPTSGIGGPHRRERVFIIAYPMCVGRMEQERLDEETKFVKLSGQDRNKEIKTLQTESIHCRPILRRVEKSRWWRVESRVGRISHGIPHGMDRLKCLGNAVVPQIAELIGRAIIEREER